MSQTLLRIIELVRRGDVRVSAHGYDELAADGILAADVIDTIATAALVRDHPTSPKGPSVLVLQQDRDGRPIHVVWGIPSGRTTPAVVVTAYRPDPSRWTDDFLRRRR